MRAGGQLPDFAAVQHHGSTLMQPQCMQMNDTLRQASSSIGPQSVRDVVDIDLDMAALEQRRRQCEVSRDGAVAQQVGDACSFGCCRLHECCCRLHEKRRLAASLRPVCSRGGTRRPS